MKRWGVHSALLAMSIVCSVLIAEILLRMLGIAYPRFYLSDPVLGHRLNPGMEGWFRSEGRAYVRINTDGWRDREHSKEKPAETLRIAVLGDSYAEALQVPLEATFWSIAEQKLNSRECIGNTAIEVLNFGVSGYGTAHELLLLQHHVLEYQPDVVLLTFFIGNDVRNNSIALETQQHSPFFQVYDKQLQFNSSRLPVQSTSAIARVRHTIYRHSRMYQLASHLKKRFASSALPSSPTRGTKIQGLELGIDSMVYKKPETLAWQEAWEVTEFLLSTMAEELRERRIGFVVALLSTGIQVYPDKHVRDSFMETLAIEELFYPEKRLKTFLHQKEIAFLDLSSIFLKHAETHNAFLHGFENTELGFGHWNQEGHRLAGESLSDYFCLHLKQLSIQP